MGKTVRILGLVAVCVLAVCGRAEKLSCRELFEKHRETNIRVFMRTMPDADSVEARRRCECMLEKLYEIDSTFVLKRGEELETLIRENFPVLRACDSVR